MHLFPAKNGFFLDDTHFFLFFCRDRALLEAVYFPPLFSLTGNKHPNIPSVNKHIFCFHMRTSYDRPKMESWVFSFSFEKMCHWDVLIHPYSYRRRLRHQKASRYSSSHMKDEGGVKKTSPFYAHPFSSFYFLRFPGGHHQPTNQPP